MLEAVGAPHLADVESSSESDCHPSSSSRDSPKPCSASIGEEKPFLFPRNGYVHDLARVFGVKSPSDIVWAHAVNSKQRLQEVLYDSDVHMIEVDVMRGTFNPAPGTGAATMSVCTGTRDKKSGKIICCHPPYNTSDITLDNLIFQVCKHNERCKRRYSASTQGSSDDVQTSFLSSNIRRFQRTPKGIKLDFKSKSSIKETIAFCIREKVCESLMSLWLNADILFGPGVMETSAIVPAIPFIENCALLPEAVISLSWKCTEYSVRYMAYTSDMICEMGKIIQQSAIANVHVTFPVCAVYAVPSYPELENILNLCDKQGLSASLTIFTGTGSMGITPDAKDEIVNEATKREMDLFLDVLVRKPGRTCNDVCVVS